MPKGMPNNPDNRRGWGDMTPEERRIEMRRRMSHRTPKQRGPALPIATTTTLRELVDSMEESATNFSKAVAELKVKVLG